MTHDRCSEGHLHEIGPADGLPALWARYKEDGDPDAREQLILNYSPLVKYVAGRLASSLPQTVETADLISYGIFGLIDAIEKFDPGRAIKFETYAIARIKGAIIDELRAMDWVPRSVRSRAREIENAYIALENKLKRVPTDAEVADEMGITDQGATATSSPSSAYTSVVSLRGAVGRRRPGRGPERDRHHQGRRRRGPGRRVRDRRDQGRSSPRRSSGFPSARRPSSRSTTTRDSPSRRSARCSASPSRG